MGPALFEVNHFLAVFKGQFHLKEKVLSNLYRCPEELSVIEYQNCIAIILSLKMRLNAIFDFES